jgi:Rod binding domain-containing protein
MNAIVHIGGLSAPGQEDPLRELQHKKSGDLEAEKLRLQKAAKEFESLFMYEMLKEMRKTVAGMSDKQDMPLANSFGKDSFTEMFDIELARRMVDGGKRSIAEMLYGSLEKLVEAQFGQHPESPEIKPLNFHENPIKFDRHHIPMPVPLSRPVELHTESIGPLKLESARISDQVDPIAVKYGHLIEEAAERTVLDSSLIYGVIRAESAGNAKAVSPKGAKGLMQLMDSTADDMNVKRVFDPKENIQGGSRYLKRLLEKFGNVKLALAAYNAGPAAVDRFRGIPPYLETREYINRVLAYAAEYAGKDE